MLSANQPALQVFQDGQWQYVFANLDKSEKVATTDARAKALHGRNLWWFVMEHGSLPFRVEKRPGVLQTDAERQTSLNSVRLKTGTSWGGGPAPRPGVSAPRLTK